MFIQGSPAEYLKSAVSRRLNELFPHIKVYDEQIKQGIQDENFVLFFAPAENRKVSATRYQMTGTLDIAYVVRDDSDEPKLKKMFQEMFIQISTNMERLEFQRFEGSTSRFRLTSFTQTEADNVLHIMAQTTIQYFPEDVSCAPIG